MPTSIDGTVVAGSAEAATLPRDLVPADCDGSSSECKLGAGSFEASLSLLVSVSPPLLLPRFRLILARPLLARLSVLPSRRSPVEPLPMPPGSSSTSRIDLSGASSPLAQTDLTPSESRLRVMWCASPCSASATRPMSGAVSALAADRRSLLRSGLLPVGLNGRLAAASECVASAAVSAMSTPAATTPKRTSLTDLPPSGLGGICTTLTCVPCPTCDVHVISPSSAASSASGAALGLFNAASSAP
mmetsp:Transcript_7454/g.22374  ORF Transcript_7454/g.22374 Transcript_7454/m.22374 type:complete len:245 (-) Transcript_7454:248-982(-)